MNPIKVFWNGKLLREIYPHATRFQVFKYKTKKLFRKVVITTSIAAVALVLVEVGGILNPKLQYQTVEAIKEVEAQAPIMDRIASCESRGSLKLKGSQFDKNGQVLINATRDIGKYQINVPTWGKKATELGYDLSTEQGNTAMAMWIYKNRGTGDWSSSANCWR